MKSQQEQRLNISPIGYLSQFINNYPDENLHQQFKLLDESFPIHRAVKGDGNCFYRAFAFLYLSNNELSSYETILPPVQWSCINEIKIAENNQIFQSKMRQLYSQYLQPLKQVQSYNKRQQILQNLFNNVIDFDQLLIGYFRSINFQHMKDRQQYLTPFLRDDTKFQCQLQRITKFGSESQGIQIYSLADAMKTKITIFCVDYDGFQPVSYMDHLEDKGFYFFYRPGHYDIVYPSTSIGNHDYSQLNQLQQKNKVQKKGFLSGLFNLKNRFADNIYTNKKYYQIRNNYYCHDSNEQYFQNFNSYKEKQNQARNYSKQKQKQKQQQTTQSSQKGKINNGYDRNLKAGKQQQKKQKKLESTPHTFNQFLGIGALALSGYIAYITLL